MVVVRESPKKQRPQSDQQWPPRSPLEALLSSPSGRKRYEDRRTRNTVSPSPVKQCKLDDSGSPSKSLMQSFADEDDDEDEDEETLQLKIKSYEAKLKLKRLQRSKSKTNVVDEDLDKSRSKEVKTSSEASKQGLSCRPLVNAVQVPHSPPRERQPPAEAVSPARVFLGLQNRAEDVSLKRPRFKLNGSDNSPTRSRSDSRGGRPSLQESSPLSNIKSFGERIAESRTNQKELAAKKDRIEKSRNTGFGITSNSLQRNSFPASMLSGSTLVASSEQQPSRTNSQSTPKSLPLVSTIQSSSNPPILEPYSGFHLKSRDVDSSSLTRALSGKQLYSIPQLLKTVKAPDYEAPDCESDYVVCGIVAHKSTPYEQRVVTQTAAGTSDPDAAKPVFMVLKLTDLEFEIDLFLFRSSVEAFYRVPVGTVVAILNPGIMKPKPHAIHSGAFSLNLSSSDDVLLEIGQSRDLGFCKAKKANGMECMQWVDGRKTEVCEYHISLKVDKARKGRMEFSTMTNRPGSAGATYGTGGSKNWSQIKGKNSMSHFKSKLKPEGKQYNSYLQETYYIAPGSNLTKFLDDADADVSAWQRGTSKQEVLRKRERDQVKERELAKKLVSLGSGQGSEYLKASVGNSTQAVPSVPSTSANSGSIPDLDDPFAPRDAASLGLLSKSAASVSLVSSSKRKHNLVSSSLLSEPMGWGDASKRGLLLPPSSPTKKQEDETGNGRKEKKRARFMLEAKGIREPGRESLGTVPFTAAQTNDFDDDDDDLEIV